MLTSKFHIDITPSDAGNHDKFVIQNLIKETASNVQLNPKAQKGFMTIIFNESEKISKDAQASLRRTMEMYVTKCRLILICENLGNLIPALLSRCLLIRCRAPTQEEMTSCLSTIANHEKFTYSDKDIKDILAQSKSNLRRAILGLQNKCIEKSYKGSTKFSDWKDEIRKIVDKVLKSQTPQTLKEVRCYDLLVNCIPVGLIIRELTDNFACHLSDEYKPYLYHFAAHYETMVHQGTKELPFIEAFLAKVMVLIAEQKAKAAPERAELGIMA